MNYILYSDESYIVAERYRSISSFSFHTKYKDYMSKNIFEILNDSDVTEFKWHKLSSAKYRFCAEKLIRLIMSELYSKNLRIDVLTWDTHDSRHNVRKRDDTRNFERMFFHLIKNTMSRREKESEWNIFPDQKTDIDWIKINDCLDSVGRWIEPKDNPLFGETIMMNNYSIKNFKQVKSHEEPCCQISDLFSGLSVFSINYHSKYDIWKKGKEISLFDSQDENESILSTSEKERFKILELFIGICKKERLGVSFNSSKRLRTYDPKNPINFWLYIPQHPEDKAPIKE